MKLTFAVLSSIFVFIGFIPYIKDIYNKKIRPQVISWFAWGFIMALGGIAMISDVLNWGALIVFIGSFLCFFIALFSLYKKTGEIKTSKYDYIFFILGVIGIVLWQTLDNPDYAIVFVIIADLSFGILTFIKVLGDPESENKFSWLMTSISGLLSLFAISYISFTEVAYPIYLFIYDSIIFLLVYKIIKKPESKKENI